MNQFPVLKTGAVTQYPAKRSTECRTAVLAFVDGREQRFREVSGPVHRWRIRLASLNASEIRALEEFVRGLEGSAGEFAFQDPEDGVVYSRCRLASDAWTVMQRDEYRADTEVMVEEVRI